MISMRVVKCYPHIIWAAYTVFIILKTRDMQIVEKPNPSPPDECIINPTDYRHIRVCRKTNDLPRGYYLQTGEYL